jgi:hypothetical protein
VESSANVGLSSALNRREREKSKPCPKPLISYHPQEGNGYQIRDYALIGYSAYSCDDHYLTT